MHVFNQESIAHAVALLETRLGVAAQAVDAATTFVDVSAKNNGTNGLVLELSITNAGRMLHKRVAVTVTAPERHLGTAVPFNDIESDELECDSPREFAFWSQLSEREEFTSEEFKQYSSINPGGALAVKLTALRWDAAQITAIGAEIAAEVLALGPVQTQPVAVMTNNAQLQAAVA